jgi:electron transport complex protein RnfC
MYEAIKYNRLPSETFITISGPSVSKSQVLRVKLGTCLKEVVDNNVKIKDKEIQFILNGLMTGHGCDITNVIVTNQTKGLIVIPNVKIEEQECNNCGLCYRICPVKVNPKRCMDKKINSKNCIDCGLCSYICPCHINLRRFLRSENE